MPVLWQVCDGERGLELYPLWCVRGRPIRIQSNGNERYHMEGRTQRNPDNPPGKGREMNCPFCGKPVIQTLFWQGWYCTWCGVGKHTAEGEEDETNSGYQTEGGFGVWWQMVPKGALIVRNEEAMKP